MFHFKDKSFPLAAENRKAVATESGHPLKPCSRRRTIEEFTSYSGEFFVGQKDLSYKSARQIIPIVQQFVPIRSVCDIGCGVGTWLRAFLEAGVQDIVGLDGYYVDKSLLEIPRSAFLEADLRQPLRLPRTFDLAMSIEVAEHLPESRSISFVEDLTRLAPVILFSAAVPRQGGTAHINEQWQSHWAAIFAQYDFATCDVLRTIIWNNADIARWYRQNMILFCRRDFLPEVPKLITRQDNALPLSIVHPQQYLEIWEEVNVRRSLQLFTGALQRAIHRRIERLLPPLRSALGNHRTQRSCKK